MDSETMLNKLDQSEPMTDGSNQRAGLLETAGVSLSSVVDDSADQPLSIEVINDVQGFDRLRDEWSNLVEKSRTHIFQTYEWQRLWWEHFGVHRRLHIVLFRRNGVLVGVAPFFLDTLKFLGRTIPCNLWLLGSDVIHASSNSSFSEYSPSDYLDIIALPGFEKNVTTALLQHFSVGGNLFDKIMLKELPEDSILMRFLVPQLDGMGWSPRISRGDICPRLHVPDTLEEFRRSLHSKVRHQLSQTKRAVTEQGLFSLETARSQEVLDRSFSEFVVLHQRRWNRLGYPGAFANEEYREFLRDVTRDFLKRGWLWFKTARNDRRCIAAQCAFKFKDYMYDYLKAFDDKSPEAKRRPGRALLLSLIEESIQEKIRVVDFLRGAEKYKFELTPDAQFNWQVVIQNPNKSGRRWVWAQRLLCLLVRFRRWFMKEVVLLHVQAKEWGFPGLAPHYGLFMWKRLRESIRVKYPKKSDSSSPVGLESTTWRMPGIEVITNINRFLALREEWDRLVEASSATIFQTFDWQWLWWKYYGERLRLHILAFRSRGQLVGIAPLCLEECSLLGVTFHRRLKFMGGGTRVKGAQWSIAQYGPSDYLDIIAWPGFETDVASSLAGYLQQSTSLYDEVEFENVPQDGVMAVTFIPQLDRHGLCSKVSRGQACPRLAVPNSLDNYLHGCTASVRRRLNQARRLSSTLGNHSLAVVQSREELQEAFRELVRLHQERWNRLGYPGLFAGLRFRPFQDEVINRFLNNGWLWFKTIHMDGQCIAARLGFKFKGCLYDYLSGLDTQSPAAHWRPGLALLVSMIEDAIQCNFRRVDLLRGSETYKLELSSDIPYNWKILILSPGAKHKLRVGLHRIIRLLEFMGSKLILEKQILHVHYREHGLPSFIVRYIAFRSKRVINKVR